MDLGYFIIEAATLESCKDFISKPAVECVKFPDLTKVFEGLNLSTLVIIYRYWYDFQDWTYLSDNLVDYFNRHGLF